MKKFFSYAWKIVLVIIILLKMGFWVLPWMIFQDKWLYLDAPFESIYYGKPIILDENNNLEERSEYVKEQKRLKEEK